MTLRAAWRSSVVTTSTPASEASRPTITVGHASVNRRPPLDAVNAWLSSTLHRSVLLDAGFPLDALRGVPILARTASLIAHLLEEQSRPIGFVLSHAGATAIGYDGPAPDGFVPRDQ